MTYSKPTRIALSLLLSSAIAAPLHAQAQEQDHKRAQAVEATKATAPSTEPTQVAAVGWNAADWDLEDSEFTPEAGWVFGKLDNGMRYIIRRNDRPEGTALVRMRIATATLDEHEDERGFAHFVEHMAFNGSTNVPEGEMIKLLEREGLAFGPDTNASTGIERTQYMLSLPRNDAELLDTALMLMRETASELTFAPDAVDRERGVVLSEKRVRNTFRFKDAVDMLNFTFPDALMPNRLPVGTLETLQSATSEGLRTYYNREYVPADTTLVVIGDFDPALVEENIQARFADWKAAPSPDQPKAGPVKIADKGRTHIYLDPALPEKLSILRHGAYIDRPDTVQNEHENRLRNIGGAILGRRLARIQRSENPPFLNARIATDDFYEQARNTEITVTTADGEWQKGMDVVVDEYRRALQYGFSEAEITEQLSNMRNRIENSIANIDTRSNNNFMSQANRIANGDDVPDSPANWLERFERTAAAATPEAVLEAYRQDQIDLADPLIRFSGKAAPDGGKAALSDAVNAAFQREIAPPVVTQAAEFAYTDFGTPGAVVQDSKTEDYGIRTLRFANGVMLNLKPTDLADDRISIRVGIDGGDQLATRENPLATTLAGLMPSGGMGQHSRDDLQTILAGRSVSTNFGSTDNHFHMKSTTTRRDFELQMQVLAAMLTDPGYRAEGLGPFRKGIEAFFAQLGKTPGSALSLVQDPRLTNDDPRFTLPPIEDFQALTFEKMEHDIADRLQNGAIEIGIVGDFDEDEVIAMIAKTFAALPKREGAFKPYDDGRRAVTISDKRGPVSVTHDGEPDQALIRYVWPTTDDEDWTEASQFGLLRSIVDLMLTDVLREELGQTYSPSVRSSLSSQYDDYGTFSMSASVDVGQVGATSTAMDKVLNQLLNTAPSDDLMQRARQPILEGLDNRLKSNSSWMGIVEDVQSDPQNLERFKTTRARYEAITAQELLALAQKYLRSEDALRFTVLPSEEALAKGVGEPAAE